MMAAAYEIERPELEGEDLSPAQAAAVRLKTDNLRLQREADERGQAGSNPPAVVNPPASESAPVEPSDTPWWMDEYRNDNRYADNHSRNVAGSAEFNAARQERNRLRVRAALEQASEAAAIVGYDKLGNPLTEEDVAFQGELAAKLQARFFEVPDPVYREGTDIEIMDPSLPLTDRINDPTTNEYRQELARREKARAAAEYEEDRQAGIPRLGREPTPVQKAISEALNPIREQVDPGYAAAKQARIQGMQAQIIEAYKRGNVIEARQLEYELSNG